MAFSLWTNQGSNAVIVGDGTDVPIWCEECPCYDIITCLGNIKERQQAYGITTAWDSGSPTDVDKLIDATGTTSYTLLQLKAYVNNIATSYISGTYSGGASAPTMLAGTYANSAADVAELCTLALAMKEIKYLAAFGSYLDGMFWRAFGYGDNYGAAKADAISSWATQGTPSGGKVIVYTSLGVPRSATLFKAGYTTVLTGVPTALNHSATLWCKFTVTETAYLAYNPCGTGISATKGDYSQYQIIASGNWATYETAAWPDTAYPTPWPPTPISNSTTYRFESTGAPFAVLKWSFTN